MKLHMLNRMASSSSRSAQQILSYRMAAIQLYAKVTQCHFKVTARSPRVTNFETADEIAYTESNDVELVAIGAVDPEL